MMGPRMAVGIGNTTVKLGLTTTCHENGWPIWTDHWEVAAAAFDPATLFARLPDCTLNWFVASVQRTAEQRLRDSVQSLRASDTYRVLTRQDLPIAVQVDAPDRVGLDRLSAAVAANRIRDPKRAAIVVDAGTAITVNLLTPDGVFQGGVILPGFTLTAKALALGTDQLPLIAADLNSEPPGVVGKSTEDAIRSGLFWGNVGAVREIVERMQRELTDTPQLFVTGGDARRLSGYVSPQAKFIPDLVLAGIVLSSVAQ